MVRSCITSLLDRWITNLPMVEYGCKQTARTWHQQTLSLYARISFIIFLLSSSFSLLVHHLDSAYSTCRDLNCLLESLLMHLHFFMPSLFCPLQFPNTTQHRASLAHQNTRLACIYALASWLYFVLVATAVGSSMLRLFFLICLRSAYMHGEVATSSEAYAVIDFHKTGWKNHTIG